MREAVITTCEPQKTNDVSGNHKDGFVFRLNDIDLPEIVG